MQAADAWHKKKKPTSLLQSKGITLTAVLPGDLLLNATGVTAEVISRRGNEMSILESSSNSKCYPSCVVKLAGVSLRQIKPTQ